MIRFVLTALLFLLCSGTGSAVPCFEGVRKSYVSSDSLLLDRQGQFLHELRTEKRFRRLSWVSLAEVSPALREAVLHAEDKRFHDHSGVDYGALGAAVIHGITREGLRGASTITMQLASLLEPGASPQKARKSVWQKARQITDAWEIEKSWGKAEILEAYLNLVTFRGELQGIGAASRGLFGKDPHGLDRTESLLLASLIRAPNAPPPEVCRRAFHLGRSLGWITQNEEVQRKASRAFSTPLSLRPRLSLAPHVARRLLKDQREGAVVLCTLNRDIQQFALDRLSHHLVALKSRNVNEGAILVVENQTGHVLAYASCSGEPSIHRYVDGVQARRQAGSTLKPFLYAEAFDRRILTPASVLDDTPLDLSVVNGIYQPRNYDSEFRGRVTVRTALASSLNVPAVKTLSLIGTESFLNRLRQIGLKGLQEAGGFYGPSLALGTADVSLWEMTNAYRTLANAGQWSELHLLPRAQTSLKREKAFSREAAFLVSDILSDREARSATFGLENPLSTRYWTAVKTGTSKDMRDNWCFGYSKKITVGVWIGNFTGEPMWNVSGISGAAPLWLEMMDFLHRGEGNRQERPPSQVVQKEIASDRSAVAAKKEWFIPGTEPNTRTQRVGQSNPRIVYPPPGTVIAIDPDIPPEFQKIFFITHSRDGGLCWVLNGRVLGEAGKASSWSPTSGVFSLALQDRDGKAVDTVHFEVRGPGDFSGPLQ